MDLLNYVWVDSARIRECVESYFETENGILGINYSRGYSDRDIAFLRSYPQIKVLSIQFPPRLVYNLEPLSELRDLEYLILGGTSGKPAVVDLSQFRKLRCFIGTWAKELSLDRCEAISDLRLRGYKSKRGDVTDLIVGGPLERLEFVQPNVVNARGIELYSGLQHLEFSYARNLNDLSAVGALNALRTLWCDHCPKLVGSEGVPRMSNLVTLGLNHCGALPGLAFLERFPALENFRFVDTNVCDGDMIPLTTLKRLKRVGFLNKRHFSHTFEEIEQLLASPH